jgi:hypothetical protein
MSQTYGYIYITTNLLNGKRYIGQHKLKDFDYSYIGSGTLLKNLLKNMGKKIGMKYKHSESFLQKQREKEVA